MFNFLIPNTVWEVITGELLGDGHLSCDPINKPLINGRLEFTFAAAILHYVNYLKFNVLAPICTTSNPTPWPNTVKGQQPLQYWFSTKRMPAITSLHSLWYKEIDGKYIKVLPINIEELLTPIAFAHSLPSLPLLLETERSGSNRTSVSFSPLWTLKRPLLVTSSSFGAVRNIHNDANGKPNELRSVFPVIKYDNADIQKLQAIKENKGKSGVYRWTNKVNGKSYVGSSINLVKRFTNYYSFNYISKSKMSISKALIKYGYSNFTLEILEFCDPSDAIVIEQHYIDILKPEYNILKIAGSSLGYTHTEETLAKFKARSFTPEQKTNNLEHLKIHNSSPEQREKSRERLLEYNKSKGQRVEVLDTISNETTLYFSIRQAAEAIGCVHGTILLADKAFKEKGVSRLLKKRYTVKILND